LSPAGLNLRWPCLAVRSWLPGLVIVPPARFFRVSVPCVLVVGGDNRWDPRSLHLLIPCVHIHRDSIHPSKHTHSPKIPIQPWAVVLGIFETKSRILARSLVSRSWNDDHRDDDASFAAAGLVLDPIMCDKRVHGHLSPSPFLFIIRFRCRFL
jgi:hypothetical protein